MSLQIGDTAPDFSLPNADGVQVSKSDFPDQPVVLYFYPRDNTPGCTKQAIAFTQNLTAFQDLGAVVLGVSKDSTAKHRNFRDKHDLEITLLSDIDDQVCEAYGVWVEKKMYGKEFFGIQRSTFLIDKNGKLANIWRKVKVAGHEEEVLSALRSLEQS